jgi:hypothetical protein
MIPEFFKQGCCSFFGSNFETFDETFWNITRDELIRGLMKAFNEDWKSYIPELYVQDGMAFIEYANQCRVAYEHKQHNHTSTVDQQTTIQPLQNINPKLNLPNIALLGEMGHGKSTVAEYLCKCHNYIEYAFADSLKHGISIIFSLLHEQLYGNLKHDIDPRWKVTPRYLMQRIGTDLFRNNISKYLQNITNVHENIWISNFQCWIKRHISYPVVISDCRFKDEFNLLSNLNFKLIHIQRTISNKNQLTTHESEHLSKSVDLLSNTIPLINNGTIEELYQKVKQLIH